MNEKEELGFEEALKEVEEILRELEKRDIELEKAVELYEKGLKLLNYCEEKLKNAKLRVQVIMKEGQSFRLETLERASELLKNGKV